MPISIWHLLLAILGLAVIALTVPQERAAPDGRLRLSDAAPLRVQDGLEARCLS